MKMSENKDKPGERRVRREDDNSWSATVWTDDPTPEEAGRYRYRTRSQARSALLSHEIDEAGRLA